MIPIAQLDHTNYISLFDQVCGEDLREATHDRAIQVLRQTPATVSMLVYRDDSQVKDEEIYDVFTVELNKKPGKGLGLSIVGRRNDVGVYISDIVSIPNNRSPLVSRNFFVPGGNGDPSPPPPQ